MTGTASLYRHGLAALVLATAAACGASESSEPTGPAAPDGGPTATPPAHVPPTIFTGFPPMFVPADNPSTKEGIALGRKLYYDRRLSPDGSRACADCHYQARAFSNPATKGVLPHINLAWATNFLWDGRFKGTLEEAMIMEVEEFFGVTDVSRMQEPDLQAMFQAAFGTPEITTKRAAYALAQFQRTMISGSARFDRFVEGDAAALNDSEKRGMELFYSERAECFHCHATRLFTDNQFHNIGLDAEIVGVGRAKITGRAPDDGKWKTPTLRNVERSAPYMHDDRFATLEQVLDFYSEGVKESDTLDTLVRPGGYKLDAGEKADLLAFLRTLTDEKFLTDPSLAPPP